jgi:large subunit ribosomal protein L31
MKGNHPELVLAHVSCNTCGNEFTIRSTQAELTLEVCSSCHPAYTGVERAVARGSRIERFERRRRRANNPVAATTR